ncbi:putative peroxisome proliferator-activated receptor gamma coactivator-related protein 1 [Triplophysa rosa]|uniref:Peroxisome proliferator-activated receptor gamma coactivator-related protein 1 n=2 Tax=Triplophysa rosa TaxID=992332 RepID=A0A9W7WN71_TRIRA|nr:putative peroxisome proliferator-activated receptor gamma coactivator-related protein 1 [Triplophysa rosa]
MLQGSFSGSCLEYHSLNNGGTLEALHGYLDPSIMSIFEDSPTVEVKSNIDEESEATLLTALTEILDNVDDENLSPFDTLPDSDLFSGQKGQEQSAPRKSLIHARHFPGKSLPRMQRASQQNSEGEEEDGDATFPTPVANIDLTSLDGFDWCLPVSLEQDGDSTSVTLGDLVKHMHPYCMTLCMEDEGGQEHLLPEGGIVLEVVDQGEHGEPILAIPDLRLRLSPHTNLVKTEQRVPEKSIAEPEPKLKGVPEKATPHLEKEKVIVKLPKNKSCHSKKMKKQESIESSSGEQRVLRSSSTRVKEMPQNKQRQEQKRKKVTFSNSCSPEEPDSPKPEPSAGSLTPEPQVEKEPIMTPQTDLAFIESKPEDNHLEKSIEAELPSKQEPSTEQPAICPNSETKPKPLSLKQYRLLRQQKKPDPVNKTEDNSTKWPTLPEAPKELPPIPCLPEPNPRDPRRLSTPVKIDHAPEIMPAWHPRGPAAPPTPEALLVPPASMMSSSKKPASSKLAAPTTCTSVDRSPSASPQKLPTETSTPALQPSSLKSPQKPPAPTSVPQNTIQTETSYPTSQTAPERALPLSTTSRGSHNTPSLKECVNRNPSAACAVEEMPVVLPEVSEQARPQKAESAATTQIQSLKPSAAVKRETEQVVLAPVTDQAKNTLSNCKKLTARSQPHVAPIAAQPFFSAQVQARVVELAEQMRMASSETQKPKNTTVELIQSFTSEIGIEACDLTSLLEQFEESQSKEEQSVPEVCGRAAAVGNSSFEQQVETKVLEKTRNHDLASTAGLTPPATPPHQMWKPIAPVALLGKTRNSELPKPTPNKVIQIEARPLPSNKMRSTPQTTTTTGQTQPFSLDHDYCLPPKEPHHNEVGHRWNVKQQPSIIIKTVELSSNKPVQQSVPKATSTPSVTEETQKNLSNSPPVDRRCGERDGLKSSVLETPDASPNRPESESPLLEDAKDNQSKPLSYSESSSKQYQDRGRSRRRYRSRSSNSSKSSSSSSSRSRSPPRKRYRSRHSNSRSSSSSLSRSRSSSRTYSPPRRRRYSYSSSRSGSWSRSRSRSRSRSSDSHGHAHWRSHGSPNQRSGYRNSQSSNEELRRRKQKAIEERRIVYVGRIRGNMTRKELKERFSYYGEIEECTVHFRENGDNYGFITYYNKKDAFDAIENGSRLREPNEMPFDLCFGGRRQFCKSNYADLDSTREYEPVSTKGKFDALDFDTLLRQAQKNLKR